MHYCTTNSAQRRIVRGGSACTLKSAPTAPWPEKRSNAHFTRVPRGLSPPIHVATVLDFRSMSTPPAALKAAAAAAMTKKEKSLMLFLILQPLYKIGRPAAITISATTVRKPQPRVPPAKQVPREIGNVD